MINLIESLLTLILVLGIGFILLIFAIYIVKMEDNEYD